MSCLSPLLSYAVEPTQHVSRERIVDSKGEDAFKLGSALFIKKDYKHAFELFTFASKQGVAEANYNLGAMYKDGLGTAVDYKKAISFYEKASQAKVLPATHNLATMYLLGAGIPKDTQKAFQYYQQAASEGYVQSAFQLGLMYQHGNGVQ